MTYRGQTLETQGTIMETPGFDIPAAQYSEYDAFMSEMEAKVTVMHDKANLLYAAQKQLAALLPTLKDQALKSEGETLLQQLEAWDGDMVQRKSQAYDDVENFPNKFTAEYLFLINATNSSIPRVNQSSKDRKTELDTQWRGLEAQADGFINGALPDYNNKLWAVGIGAIRTEK
ncbi:MAG: hypothetical protein E4H26_12415 [Flavobacteriales bacterium]|nr:MAG: hypothetical protein E4H26_12415 [Flavobacteriales bacterium]